MNLFLDVLGELKGAGVVEPSVEIFKNSLTICCFFCVDYSETEQDGEIEPSALALHWKKGSSAAGALGEAEGTAEGVRLKAVRFVLSNDWFSLQSLIR